MAEASSTSPDAPGPVQPGGDEPSSSGVRTAVIVRWGLVAAMAVAAIGAWSLFAATGGTEVTARARWRCPMHPTVVAERKGECPICGMDLVQAAPASAAPAAAAGYTCPMHPRFVTPDPAVRCPECGMKLVPKSPDVAPTVAGPPGLAPIELSAERIQLVGVKTAVATREALAATLRTVGFVAASEQGLASVSLRFAGWIEALRGVDLGQYVERGQVLATVYSPDALVAQQQFLATARWAEPAAGAASAPDATAPQRDVARDARQRLLLLGLAEEDIDALAASGKPANAVNVRAPVSGHVARRAAVRGLYAQPGTELFQIADLSTVWVIADVHESELGRVKVGQRASLELAAYPGERFAGRIAFVYPALAAGSRTLQARVELRNPGLRLRPGMFGDVTVELGAERAVVVPAEALIDTGERRYVFVSKGSGRFEPREVRVGWSAGGKVAVQEGVAEGERVVTTASFLLDSESRLRAAVEGFGPR